MRRAGGGEPGIIGRRIAQMGPQIEQAEGQTKAHPAGLRHALGLFGEARIVENIEDFAAGIGPGGKQRELQRHEIQPAMQRDDQRPFG